ncbi:hypothetical protein, partial [Pseudomonas aeruginosa]|uniref:hypothetical protein n=2 Tax=Pseudomonas aeruginosa TaxID=287 RepID=UPI0022CE264B
WKLPAVRLVAGEWPFLYRGGGGPNSNRTGRRRGQEGRWADIYACLIAGGYGTPATIGRMTERQILLLYDAEQRRLSHHRANQVIDTNLALAGGNDAKEHLKTLRT